MANHQGIAPRLGSCGRPVGALDRPLREQGMGEVEEERLMVQSGRQGDGGPGRIIITPRGTSITVISGQSVTVTFSVEVNTSVDLVRIGVRSVPAGVICALSPQFLPESGSDFFLTLTAAEDVTPAEATINIGLLLPPRGFSAIATVAVNVLASGQVLPTYQILTMLYAPPGTNGGRSSSQVSYASGSTTGTTDSISHSFKDGLDVNASVGGALGSVKLGASADFSASKTGTTTSQVSINKGINNQINDPGPSADGIDHGHDVFYLWLNPLLNVTIDHLGKIAWEIGVNGQEMLIQYVYVEWLQNPSLMPPGVAQALTVAGLTMADYAQILACNPFSSGDTAIDPNRFVPITHSFPYEPPAKASDTVPTSTQTLTSATTTTNTQQVQTQYGVSVTVSAGFHLIWDDSLKITASLQWTNTSTSTQTTGSTQQASVTIGGPAFGYTGPTDVLVYWDTIYLSFMFAFATESPSASGAVIDSGGNPVPNQAMTLAVGSITLSTFTDSRGQYNFYGAQPGRGTVTVESQKFPVAVGEGEPSPTLRLNSQG
jgi:hypothetical protein